MEGEREGGKGEGREGREKGERGRESNGIMPSCVLYKAHVYVH